MERGTALVVSAASALLAAGAVVAGATGALRWPGEDTSHLRAGAIAGASEPSVATTVPAPQVVTETKDVYDTIVVPSTPRSGQAPSGPTGQTPSTASSGTEPPTTTADTEPEPEPDTTTTTEPSTESSPGGRHGILSN